MRVAFYMTTNLEHMGGFEKSFIDIAKGLKKYTSVDVEIFTMDDAHTKRVNQLYSLYFAKNLTILSAGRESKSSINEYLEDVKYTKCSTFKELRQKLNNFDVVYSKNEVLEASIFKYRVRYSKIPPVIFLCGTALFYPETNTIQSKLHNWLYGGPIYKTLASGVAGFHTKNQADLELLKSKFNNKFFAYIPNPFDFSQMRIQAKRNSNIFKVDNHKHNLLWAARLTDQKGLSNLIKIIEAVNKNRLNSVQWFIAGEGEDGESFKNKLSRWNNITVLGHVPSAHMPALYSKCDIFLMTSKWESFGNTIIEAQTFDLPAISYNINGPRELIINAKTGYLVEDTHEYVKTLEFLISKPKVKDESISKYVESKYGIKPVSIKLSMLFNDFFGWLERVK